MTFEFETNTLMETPQTEVETPISASQPEEQNLTLSVDEFAALEERVLRAVALVKSEREARIAAEQRATQAEQLCQQSQPALEQLQGEINSLRTERDLVRQRVERLLTQLDALEL